MAAVPVRCRYALATAWMVATLAFGASAFGGQGMRFFPIRVAPLGSDVGTVGDPVTPQFNEDLGCWELQLPAGTDGFEVDLGLQVFGWGMATGSPTLGAIQATVMSAGFNNGNRVELNPKGWPDDPGTGGYQSKTWCDPA
ncbi:MAG: hypothetical protein IIB57_14815, partial [Planctomycetes bacterium]|nr:hypothetical protein [Planctomycetota bacterium]